jgi:hypothetical protein
MILRRGITTYFARLDERIANRELACDDLAILKTFGIKYRTSLFEC